MLITIMSTIVLSLLFLQYMWEKFTIHKFNIPGPRPLFLFGNGIMMLIYQVHNALLKCYLDYGDVCLIWLGITPFVLVHNPEYAKEILQTQSHKYRKGMFADIMKPLVGVGLLTSEGETWKLHHKHCNIYKLLIIQG